MMRRLRVLSPDVDAAGAGDCDAAGVPEPLPATTGGTSVPDDDVVPLLGRPIDDGGVTAEPPTDATPELPLPPVVVVEPVPAPSGGAAAPTPPPLLTSSVLLSGALNTIRSSGPGRISTDNLSVATSFATSANSTELPLSFPGTQALPSYLGTSDHWPF